MGGVIAQVQETGPRGGVIPQVQETGPWQAGRDDTPGLGDGPTGGVIPQVRRQAQGEG